MHLCVLCHQLDIAVECYSQFKNSVTNVYPRHFVAINLNSVALSHLLCKCNDNKQQCMQQHKNLLRECWIERMEHWMETSSSLAKKNSSGVVDLDNVINFCTFDSIWHTLESYRAIGNSLCTLFISHIHAHRKYWAKESYKFYFIIKKKTRSSA